MNQTAEVDNTAQMQAIVTEGLTAGQKKNDIVTRIMHTDATLSLSQAFTIYNECAKSSGLLMDKEAKDKLLAEVAASHTKDGALDKDKAIDAFVERARVSKSTASTKLRDYCASNGIAFPTTVRVKRDMAAVKAAVQAWHNEGVDRESILAGLKQHYQYTDNSAADAYRSIGKELGFLEGRSSENREAIAKWFKENGTGERKDIIKALSDNFKMTENTASGYYSMFLFAKTYCNLK